MHAFYCFGRISFGIRINVGLLKRGLLKGARAGDTPDPISSRAIGSKMIKFDKCVKLSNLIMLDNISVKYLHWHLNRLKPISSLPMALEGLALAKCAGTSN